MCVCLCVCVRERGDGDIVNVCVCMREAIERECVCVFVCLRERKRDIVAGGVNVLDTFERGRMRRNTKGLISPNCNLA